MLKIVTKNVTKCSHHYPKTAAIVTASAQGKDNAMTAAWHSPISLQPPLYGVSISPNRFTHHLIAKSEEFGINKVKPLLYLGSEFYATTDKDSLKFIQRGI